jgi:guanylate kinase
LLEVLKKYEGVFEKKVSYTTRDKKKFEKEGNNYTLISREEFQKVSCINFYKFHIDIFSYRKYKPKILLSIER